MLVSAAVHLRSSRAQVTAPAQPGALVVDVRVAGARIKDSPSRVPIGRGSRMMRAAPLRQERIARADLDDANEFAIGPGDRIAGVHYATSEVALLTADASRELWRREVSGGVRGGELGGRRYGCELIRVYVWVVR